MECMWGVRATRYGAVNEVREGKGLAGYSGRRPQRRQARTDSSFGVLAVALGVLEIDGQVPTNKFVVPALRSHSTTMSNTSSFLSNSKLVLQVLAKAAEAVPTPAGGPIKAIAGGLVELINLGEVSDGRLRANAADSCDHSPSRRTKKIAALSSNARLRLHVPSSKLRPQLQYLTRTRVLQLAPSSRTLASSHSTLSPYNITLSMCSSC
jgi:hypothetical protein